MFCFLNIFVCHYTEIQTLYIHIYMSTQTQLPYAGAQQYYSFPSIYEQSSVKAHLCLVVFEPMLAEKRALWCQTQIIELLLALMFAFHNITQKGLKKKQQPHGIQ